MESMIDIPIRLTFNELFAYTVESTEIRLDVVAR